jgi:hypothetical protein
VQKIRTAHRLPAPGQWCLIAGRDCPHVARWNGNDGWLVTGFLPGVKRPADRVDWWAALPPEFTEQYDAIDAEVECRVEGWGPQETVRSG